MKKFLTLTAAAFLTIGLSACGQGGVGRNVELSQAQNVSSPGSIGVDAMHNSIIKGSRDRNWTVVSDVPGKITLRLDSREHSVVVDVPYTSSTFRVEYISSQNLNYAERDGRRYIHPSYQRWVRNLEQSIQRTMPITGVAPRAYR